MGPWNVIRFRNSVFWVDRLPRKIAMAGFHPKHSALFLGSSKIARSGCLRTREFLSENHRCGSHLGFVETAQVSEGEFGASDKRGQDIDRLERIEHRWYRENKRGWEIIEWSGVKVVVVNANRRHDG